MRFEAFFLRDWQRASAWQILLRPMSLLYMVMTAIRSALYRTKFLHKHRARVPVVVVGNITVGGTGKTTVVLAIAQRLLEAKQSPGIVTRGYAPVRNQAKFPQVIHVLPQANKTFSSSETAFGLSDEAQLLALRSGVPVYTGVKRALAVETLLSKHVDVNLVISDDGLQHYALDRDIEIAVVDGVRGFGNGFMLPAGPLREPSSRLQAVDCIVLNNTNIDDSFQEKMPEKTCQVAALRKSLETADRPVFVMTYGNEIFVPLQSDHIAGHNAPQGETTKVFVEKFCDKRIAAMAGIGHPERFFSHLERLGIILASRHAFPDHYAFARADVTGIDADVIVMTEKDAVKCFAYGDERMWAMRIDALLPDAFYKFMLKKIDDVTRPKVA
ncbi:MAG: tetraacyldisaccharide 4'-kinase [Pseudomonadota bacterium]